MPIEGVALPKLSLDTLPEATFYIPATGPATRPRRALKHDNTFVVFDSHGDIGASAGGTDGLFHCDTRFLSHFELLLNGMQPLLLSSTMRDDNDVAHCDLTNPEIAGRRARRLVAAEDLVARPPHRFLWNARGFERLAISNYDTRGRVCACRSTSPPTSPTSSRSAAPSAPAAAAHPPEVDADAVTLLPIPASTTGCARPGCSSSRPHRTGHRERRRSFDIEHGARHARTTFFSRSAAARLRRPPPARLFAGCRAARRALRARRRAPRRSPPPTRSSTRPSAARCPTFTCW